MIDTIFGTVLDRLIININIKELGQITLFRRSYSIMNVGMADFASCRYDARRMRYSSSRYISIAQFIFYITIEIYVQKSSAMDHYWWRYGSAKFDAEMMSFEANTRRAIASSILVCCQHIMHITVALMSYIIVRDEKLIWHRRPIQSIYTTRGY